MDNENQTPAVSLQVITCVVQRGKGDAIGKAAVEAGAGGTTTFFARGAGTREKLGLLGLAIVPEKEVVIVICKEEECPRIFDAISKAGKLDVPGMGIAYITPIIKVVGGSL